MATYAVTDETLTQIANAIRGKTDSDEMLHVSAFAAAIEGISGGGSIRTGTVTVTGNTEFQIDVGTDSFTHFLLIQSVMPTLSAIARQIYVRYTDFGKNTGIEAVGPNTANSSVVNGNLYYNRQVKNGSVVSEKIGAVSSGVFNAGDEFNWFAW